MPLLGFQERFAAAARVGAIRAALDRYDGDPGTCPLQPEEHGPYTYCGHRAAHGALRRTLAASGISVERARRLDPRAPFKRQTIRARRRDGRDPKPGDTLHLWTGLRQPGARKLGQVTCQSVMPIHFFTDREVLCLGFHEIFGPWPQCDARFAKADGFASFGELVDWIDETHGLPFEGLVIRW